MLLDKPYYDYDYEFVEPKTYAYDKTVWSQDKVNDLFKGVGKTGADGEMDRVEMLQRDAMNMLARERKKR